MTPEWKALEAEVFPQRKSKRVHIAKLQAAFIELHRAYVFSIEPKETWWKRWLSTR